jgi:RNA exonuclease 1
LDRAVAEGLYRSQPFFTHTSELVSILFEITLLWGAMTKSQKRKFGEYSRDPRPSQHFDDYDGVDQLLADLNTIPHEKKSLPEVSQEWQTVERKNGVKAKRKRAGDEKDRVKYPELACHGKVTVPIRIADLQALVLYTLADGVAPNWVAFKHAHHTRKVVILMAPGLEKDMFNGTSFFEADPAHPHRNIVRQPGTPEDPSEQDSQNRRDFHGWKTGERTNVLREGNPMNFAIEAIPEALKPLADIFDEIWPVKAPGDSRYYKLHSPIQAMLVSPLPQSKENKAIKGPKPPTEERGWQPQRTPVTQFIHSVDELREAEYPLHPAIFNGDDEVLALENERRRSTGQDAEGGWVDTRVLLYSNGTVSGSVVQRGSTTAGRTVYAVDCEMVLTTDDKYSLARISIVDWDGKVVLDELVKPSLPIKNYFTQFSGMTSSILDPVMTTLAEIQLRLLDLFTPHTILLGHSLESDLAAMKLTHPFIIDTSLIYPHPRGPPLRSSLKFLAQKYLRRDIQQQDSKGHNSVEDALAVLDLVKLKCEKGPRWGTSEAAGEPIFRRLARTQRKDASGVERGVTSAMIDYGTPERGYGKEAAVHVGCQSDQEIVNGITRAIKGDADGKEVPGGGVDFTWGRLRELESFRGWCNNNREYGTVDKLHAGRSDEISAGGALGTGATPSSPKPNIEVGGKPQLETTKDGAESPSSLQISSTPSLKSAIVATVSHIRAVYDALPPCTLYVVYTGTGDPREVGRLQKMQQQYRKEFRIKKWDDLTVKWTDDEEQTLRKAVERAREGMALMCVK